MLDTASIIRHLDAKVRQHMQGDSGGEARRSVSMLLTLLGGQEADSVNSLAMYMNMGYCILSIIILETVVHEFCTSSSPFLRWTALLSCVANISHMLDHLIVQ